MTDTRGQFEKSIKLVVSHKDGTKERLTMLGPLTLMRGEKLDRILTATGTEHWFDKDGYYDGWGRSQNLEGDPEDALKLADAISNEREIVASADELQHDNELLLKHEDAWAQKVVDLEARVKESEQAGRESFKREAVAKLRKNCLYDSGNVSAMQAWNRAADVIEEIPC